MKILTVVGARPQFIKASVVSRALRKRPSVREVILHTGQHYDPEMSDVFFRELEVPRPYKNLDVGSAPHGAQTGKMMVGIEAEAKRLRPDRILVYGDTNSTLAGALVASKLRIPLAHVEAGLRSFNRAMPEEINRVVADRLSDLLFAPTQTAVENLRREGITTGVHRVGDVMADAVLFFRERSRRLPAARVGKLVPDEPYFVLTLHRQETVDDPRRLKSIFKGLAAGQIPFLFPVHPRTAKALRRLRLGLPGIVRPIPPVSYLEMILLQDRAVGVWTDSGGMQKESVVLGKPCFTLRDETEWVETVKEGWNRLLGADPRRIRQALQGASDRRPPRPFPVARFYGDGRGAERIAKILSKRPRSC